jgi:hypothetical protein
MKQINNVLKKISLLILAIFGLATISNAQCAAGEVEVFIDVTTDTWGYEVYWELVPSGTACGSGSPIFSGGNTLVGCAGGGLQAQSPGGYANSSTITEPATATGFCLTIGDTFDIIGVDDWGDGGTCFASLGQSFNFCMTGANSTFTFVASAPIQDDIQASSNNGEYTSIPSTQIPSGGLTLEANVRNNGTVAVVDAVVTSSVYLLPSSTPIQSNSSVATNIASGATAVLSAGSFTPAAPGNYLVEYTTSMTAVTDSDNSNDTSRYFVTITSDGSYSRDDGTLAVELGLNGTYGELGNVFDYPNAGYKMDSVLFYFSAPLVGDTTSIKIYDVVGGVPSTQIGTSGDIIITSADTGGVIKVVPVTNMTGGPLSITSNKVFVAATDSETGFLGLGFSAGIYTAGGTMANITGGAFSNLDALGFPNTAIIRPIISYDCQPIASTSSTTNASCGNADGSATVTPSGGFAPYTLVWDAAAGNQATATASGLASGSYVVVFTDSLGCSDYCYFFL